jgi:hypothetical protein
VAAVIAALVVASGWLWPKHPPPAAFAPVVLHRLSGGAAATCRSWQRRTPLRLLCPTSLPRATLGPANIRDPRPPRLSAVVVGAPKRPGSIGLLGFEFSYSAPVEPTSGPGWRQHLWHNRPCCFLHFGVYRLVRPAGRLPAGVSHAVVGGRRGLMLPAVGNGLAGRTGVWWANHAWFFWRAHAAWYVATLHHFGRPGETRRLLGRLVRELVPAATVR